MIGNLLGYDDTKNLFGYKTRLDDNRYNDYMEALFKFEPYLEYRDLSAEAMMYDKLAAAGNLTAKEKSRYIDINKKMNNLTIELFEFTRDWVNKNAAQYGSTMQSYDA